MATVTNLTNEKPIAMHLKSGTADGLLIAASQIADLARCVADDDGNVTTKATVQETLDSILTVLAQKMNQSFLQGYSQSDWYKLTNYERTYENIPDGLVVIYDVTTPVVVASGVEWDEDNNILTLAPSMSWDENVLTLTSKDEFQDDTLTLYQTTSSESEEKSSVFNTTTGTLTFADDTTRDETTGYITLGSSITRDDTSGVVTITGTTST